MGYRYMDTFSRSKGDNSFREQILSSKVSPCFTRDLSDRELIRKVTKVVSHIRCGNQKHGIHVPIHFNQILYEQNKCSGAAWVGQENFTFQIYTSWMIYSAYLKGFLFWACNTFTVKCCWSQLTIHCQMQLKSTDHSLLNLTLFEFGENQCLAGLSCLHNVQKKVYIIISNCIFIDIWATLHRNGPSDMSYQQRPRSYWAPAWSDLSLHWRLLLVRTDPQVHLNVGASPMSKGLFFGVQAHMLRWDFF